MEITKEYIKEGQYKTTDYLAFRIELHTLFSNYSFHSWVYSKLPVTRPVRVLQAATGTGQFFAENYYKFPVGSSFVLGDISQAMIDRSKERLKFMENTEFRLCDMESLPFDDDSFDVVLAHHCIYHTNPLKTVPELKRVVKRDGFVSITTNSQKHMLNVFELGMKIDPNFPRDRHIDPFVSERADEILPKYFSQIEKSVSNDVLKVTRPEYVTGFIRSEIEARQPNVRPDFYDLYNAEVEAVIREKHFYEIPKISPLFVCRK